MRGGHPERRRGTPQSPCHFACDHPTKGGHRPERGRSGVEVSLPLRQFAPDAPGAPGFAFQKPRSRARALHSAPPIPDPTRQAVFPSAERGARSAVQCFQKCRHSKHRSSRPEWRSPCSASRSSGCAATQRRVPSAGLSFVLGAPLRSPLHRLPHSRSHTESGLSFRQPSQPVTRKPDHFPILGSIRSNNPKPLGAPNLHPPWHTARPTLIPLPTLYAINRIPRLEVKRCRVVGHNRPKVCAEITDQTMPVHTASSLFERNIRSAKECLRIFDGLSRLEGKNKSKWLLRAAVMFAVSALDTYFHDKVKYRVGRFTLNDLPPHS